MNILRTTTSLPAVRTDAAAPSATPPASTSSTQADTYAPSLQFAPGPNDTHIAAVPEGWSTDAASQTRVADALLAHMKAWPSLHAVIAVGPRDDGATGVMVASERDEVSESTPGGVHGIISSLASAPSVKAAAAATPAPFEAAASVEATDEATVYQLRLPAGFDVDAVSAALAEGRQPNQRDMLAGFIGGLPKGQRCVVLLAGPSGAGKTSLIKDLQALSGDRKVVALMGDMYFRDVDDPDYPKTAAGTHNFDDPKAMHMDELAADIETLVSDGEADIPVYDFTASRPGGWRTPIEGVTGMRLDRKEHLALGADDVLVIDSIHAANEQIVGELQESGLPQYTLYLDSQRAEDRLLRRIVRDFASREGAAERTLKAWDLSTFPGEVHFVRPTMLQMDPARDLYYVTKFPNDLGLTRAEIEHKVAQLDAYGLAPTYDAFRTPDEGLPAFAQSERTRLEGVIASASATDAEKGAAQRALDRLSAAHHT